MIISFRPQIFNDDKASLKTLLKAIKRPEDITAENDEHGERKRWDEKGDRQKMSLSDVLVIPGFLFLPCLFFRSIARCECRSQCIACSSSQRPRRDFVVIVEEKTRCKCERHVRMDSSDVRCSGGRSQGDILVFLRQCEQLTRRRCWKTVRTVLKGGGDPNILSADGQSPVHLLCMKKITVSPDAPTYKKEREAWESLMKVFCSCCFLARLYRLVWRTNMHISILVMCPSPCFASDGKLVLMQVVLDLGADINQRDGRGVTPLMLVVTHASVSLDLSVQTFV